MGMASFSFMSALPVLRVFSTASVSSCRPSSAGKLPDLTASGTKARSHAAPYGQRCRAWAANQQAAVLGSTHWYRPSARRRSCRKPAPFPAWPQRVRATAKRGPRLPTAMLPIWRDMPLAMAGSSRFLQRREEFLSAGPFSVSDDGRRSHAPQLSLVH